MNDNSGNHVVSFHISPEVYFDSEGREMVQQLTDYIHDAMSDSGYLVDEINWQTTVAKFEVTVTDKPDFYRSFKHGGMYMSTE